MFMRFKSTSKDGLLLWRGESPMRANSDYLSLGLQDGALIFRYKDMSSRVCIHAFLQTIEDQKHHTNMSYSPYSYNLGSGAAAVVINGTFSDGKWHRVKAVRSDMCHTASNHYSACLSLLTVICS